jgi:hypothetical protein
MRAVGIGFLVFRILAAVWIAAIGVFAGLQGLGYISFAAKLEPLAWTVSLIIIGLESIGSLVRERFEVRRVNLEKQLDRWSLTFVLEQLGTSAMAFEDLGVSVWVPTTRSRFAVWLFKKSRTDHRFARLNRFRPQGHPQQSSITWTGAMGTVGQCWKTQKAVYWDARVIAAKYGEAEISTSQYERIPMAVTRGFSREQFVQVVGKYAEVRAIPIMHTDTSKAKMIGVLSIDRVFDRDDLTPKKYLDGKSTLHRAEAAAAGVSASLAGKHRA